MAEFCEDAGDERICYHLRSEKGVNWAKGHQRCEKYNATLPIIRSEKEMSILKNYLDCLKEKVVRNFTVWLSGRWNVFQKWTWIDGSLKKDALFANQTGWYGRVMTGGRNGFSIEDKEMTSSYICQFDGKCTHGNEISLPMSCLIPYYKKISWYEAREACANDGGRLAVLGDQVLNICFDPSNDDDDSDEQSGCDANDKFWIGLRKGAWFWNYSRRESEEVNLYGRIHQMHTLTSDHSDKYKSGEQMCISSNGSTGDWKISFCKEQHSLVCQKRVMKLKDHTIFERIGKYAFISAITAAAALLCLVLGGTLWCIFRKKRPGTSGSKREPSLDNQYQGLKTASARHDSERNDNYEVLDLQYVNQ